MRLLLGMVLGAALTIGITYYHDTMQAPSVFTEGTAQQRTMVNWDVVASSWASFKTKAQHGWTELRARVEKS